jgi:hypothetical protein
LSTVAIGLIENRLPLEFIFEFLTSASQSLFEFSRFSVRMLHILKKEAAF